MGSWHISTLPDIFVDIGDICLVVRRVMENDSAMSSPKQNGLL